MKDIAVNTIKPVVLSGGSGSRLWPLSRAKYPKQFLPLYGGKSLFVQTLERVSTRYGFADPMVIANEEHRFIVNEQAKEAGIDVPRVILEPVGRNTAPAVAIAALLAYESDPKTLLLFLPSDHVITDTPGFHKSIECAAHVADQGYLCCFGMQPTRPETGYGYIASGAKVEGREGAFLVRDFKEKPNAETAEHYVQDGGYSWNSGLFMFRADMVIAEFEIHAPEILTACRTALAHMTKDMNFERLDKTGFQAVPADSIDYALMEKTKKAAVIPSQFGWSDVGSYATLASAHQADAAHNVGIGDVMFEDSEGCYVHADHKLVAALGLKDMVVVSTDDAVLVAPKSRDQDVKKIVEQIKSENRPEAELHSTVYRPWGNYSTLVIGDRYQVKEIVVYPGKRLSLQYHHKRAEHWVIVSGEAVVTCGDDVKTMGVDQSIYIPMKAKHRLENKTDQNLRLIEVQTGSYLGEDDIVRLDDDFGRIKP